MVQINFALKEVNCKIVYYGPGMSGKTTNLEKIHEKTPKTNAGELTSIATEGDRTLFFDFMPLDLGTIAGMKTKFQIYTVPGQVYYNSTRKIVLQGADGVIFVGDSQPDKAEENRESLKNLEENLKEHGLEMGDVPVVIQWNKQDLPGVWTCEQLDKELNPWGFPSIPASAFTGDGVFPTLKKMSQLVIAKLNDDHGKKSGLKRAPPKVAAGPKPTSVDSADAAGVSAGKAKKLSASEILKAKMKEKQVAGDEARAEAAADALAESQAAEAAGESKAPSSDPGMSAAEDKTSTKSLPKPAPVAKTGPKTEPVPTLPKSSPKTEPVSTGASGRDDPKPQRPARPATEEVRKQEPRKDSSAERPKPKPAPSRPTSAKEAKGGTGVIIAILVGAVLIAGVLFFVLNK